MDFDQAFLLASICEQAEQSGLVKKAGETPTVSDPLHSLEEVMIRGLIGADTDEALTEEQLEVFRALYGHVHAQEEQTVRVQQATHSRMDIVP